MKIVWLLGLLSCMMQSQVCIETPRLILRPWTECDVVHVQKIMQEPEVYEWMGFHALHIFENMQKLAVRANNNIAQKGFGYFVCEDKATHQVIGMAGLNYIELSVAPFPCYTVSWTLSRNFWGNGYATEAAQALLELGFKTYHIPEIYACTTVANNKSIGVMKRLGMQYCGVFNFPGIDVQKYYCKHVLYKLCAQ